MERGRYLVADKDYAGAMAEYTKAIECDPSNAKAYGFRSGLYIMQKDLAKAEQDVKLMREMAPNELAEWHCRRGFLFEAQRDMIGAISEWAEALAHDPYHGTTLFRRGQLFMHRKQYPQAIQDFKQATHSEIIKPHCNLFFMAICHMALQEWAEALEALARCLRHYPNYDEAHFYRARVYAKLDNWTEVQNEYMQVLRRNPTSVEAYLDRADLSTDYDKWRAAIDDCNISLTLKPDEAKAYYYRGVNYYFLNNTQQAQQDLIKAVQLKPKYKDAYLFLGKMYMEFGMFKEAIQLYNQVIQLDAKSAVAYYHRGIAYERTGQRRLAEVDLEKAGKLNPQYRRPVEKRFKLW